MKTLWKILGGIGLLLVIAFAGAIGKIVGKFTTGQFYEDQKEGALDTVLVNAASHINKKLPMMVDAETRLDSASVFKMGLRLNYTVVNYSAEEIDSSSFNNVKRKDLMNKLCNTDETKIFVENKTSLSLSHAYYGKNGKQFSVITVQGSQCKSS
ncbi:hypothetical protein [Leucothrix pacifica]|uniref:Uncharacterized protein n=1 Tax=Leucothrix pacifica TaxID=1247513 RepID=A0A317C4Z0_9GAMM|nr:hypothetical protein [Leucothrix pacifica]PWQ92433.1 hypothetical protein DKW60_21290 [Leucothrix pacifica]